MPDHVLIVDDDADLADVVQVVLEANGFTTMIATNGREALDAVSVHMPAVIVLDMSMPIMNGWEFAQEFAARHGRASAILVLTAAENARARAAEVDADQVLAKPFDSKELIANVIRLAATQAARVPRVPRPDSPAQRRGI